MLKIGMKVEAYKGRCIGVLIEGEEQRRQEEKFATTRRLRNAGISDTQIHQFTDLPLDGLRFL